MKIGYARISTDQQNLDLQIKALEAEGCEKIFSDKASGSKDDRPNLLKALKYVRPGDTLVVWRLDRLGRSLRHLVVTVLDLAERSVSFKALTGAAIDTTKPEGRLIFGIFASLAEFERSLIQERINAGIKAAKNRGVKFGRPRKLTPELLALANSRRCTESVSSIAKDLGVSRATLYAAINLP